jgi:ADP-dependent NAD(P)H-hydrate dehydratase / NAD(P)H-hydrate epimerase
MPETHPVLTCAESFDWEKKILKDDDTATWRAMTKSGEAVAKAALADYREIRPVPVDGFCVLVLCGGGHNAGDALVAARKILQQLPGASALAILATERVKMRPMALRALSEYEGVGTQAQVAVWGVEAAGKLKKTHFDLCIEGLVGMRMTPPLRDPIPEIVALVNAMDIDMRVAVDLPAGLGDENDAIGFVADFTYATGIAKAPLFNSENLVRTGRIRYLDIGFFDDVKPGNSLNKHEILLASTVRPLCALRKANSDKRTYGHLFILGGSRTMPGALAMSTMAAIRSGTGLVSTLIPANVSTKLATLAPEAMWISLAVNNEGSMNVDECLRIIRKAVEKATALVIGPGMDLSQRETRSVVSRVIRETSLPIVIDASALIEEAVIAATSRPSGTPPVVFTPHLGEFARIAGAEVMEPGCDIEKIMIDFSRRTRSVLLLKGSITRIAYDGRIVYNPFGGPVLSRGGSGDILSGMIGAILARQGADAFESVCCATVWNGLAAEHLARERGQQAVRTIEILDHLSPALREI